MRGERGRTNILTPSTVAAGFAPYLTYCWQMRNNQILWIVDTMYNLIGFICHVRTDNLIHKMIRSKFEHSTVLTISHRLKTVIDNDKIMVIDDGVIKEYDTPDCLLQNQDGYLYKMVAKLGRTTLEQFIEIAKKRSIEKKNEKK